MNEIMRGSWRLCCFDDPAYIQVPEACDWLLEIQEGAPEQGSL